MTAAAGSDGVADPPLGRAQRAVAGARRALVLTGAGVSADSGMPTFRGEDGLWEDHRPEELATPAAFRRDPRLVWEWYAWRRGKARACEPNAGHLALARWSVRAPGVWLATQNVDGLHGRALERVRAGAVPPPDDRLLQLHGSLFRVRCTECEHREEHRAPVDTASRETLPRCPSCDALLRPDVVWFGESLDPEVLGAAAEAAREADVCLSVGTSAAVEPAASLGRLAVRSGAELLEVNPEETALSFLAAVALRGRAAELLPELLNGGADPR